MSEIGWIAEGQSNNLIYIKKLGPISIAKTQRPRELDQIWLKKLRHNYHILTAYVEPSLCQADLPKMGWLVEPFANSATSIIDLNLDEQDLLSSFKQKTRYNIGYATKKNNLQIITKEFQSLTPHDLQIFKTSRESWSKRKGVIGYEESFIKALLKHFSSSGWLHFAYQEDVCVATLMILKNNESAIYYSAFAEPIGYSLFAPTLLTWQALTTAKKNDCTIFDFGGIYDPRYKNMYKKWQGFTKFKEGFSPTVITYPPTQLLLGW
ncbi:MAG: peptidoglycan bridge formation glycyltransferase FemA/FemB family protein [bacterium]